MSYKEAGDNDIYDEESEDEPSAEVKEAAAQGGGGKRGHGDRRQGHRTFPVHFFRRRRLLSEAAEFSSPELAPLRSSSQ